MMSDEHFWMSIKDLLEHVVSRLKGCSEEKRTLERERAEFLREKQEWSQFLAQQQQETRESRQELVHVVLEKVSEKVALEMAQFRAALQQLVPSSAGNDVFSRPAVYGGQDVSDWDGRPPIHTPLSSQPLPGGQLPPGPPPLNGPPPPRDGSGPGSIGSATSGPLLRKPPPVRMKFPPSCSSGGPLQTKVPPPEVLPVKQAPSYTRESYESRPAPPGAVPKKAPPKLDMQGTRGLGHF
mmetsp:Transcript_7786/g.21332  ORF Transcript_7786/g.21332 Transcript_7786/m.21332 type:complete len:238 (-) Transcript_7786:56-769(-)